MPEPKPAAEILGRLCAKTVDPSVPGGGSGVDVLSSHDIAASMTGLPRGPALLLRIKYAGDDSCRAELLKILITKISRKAKAKGWTVKNPEWFGGMAMLALQEAEITPQLCRRCKGRNGNQVLVLVPARGWVDCPACDGTGRHKHAQSARARFVGVPRESWRRTWSDRQDWTKSVLIAWEAQAIMSMIRQLRRAE